MYIDKNLLVGLGDKYNIDIDTTLNFLKQCIEDIIVQKNIPVTNNSIEIKILNEFSTENITPKSKLEVAVVFCAPNIELNTLRYNKNTIKQFLSNFKLAWKKYKIEKKHKRKRRKSEEYTLENQGLNTLNQKKYTFNNLFDDIQTGLTQYFDTETTIYKTTNEIIISNKQEIGFDIILYFGCNLFENNFKLYYDKKFNKINFGRRYENLTNKSYRTTRKVYTIGRMINALFLNNTENYNEKINQILLESCLFSCPDKFYNNDDNCISFYQIISYLNYIDFSNIISITDAKKSILNEDLITKNDIIRFKSFIKSIRDLIL